MGARDAADGISRSRLLLVVVLGVALMGAGAGALSGGGALLENRPFGIGSDSALSDAPQLTVAAADPVDVRNDAGDVGTVTGSLGGSLVVRDDVDRIELLVRSRLPDGSKVESTRLTTGAVTAGTVDIGSTVGGPGTVYLDADQSDGFDVAVPGSVAVRRGAISVTARLFATDGTVTSVNAADEYEFTVDRPAARVVSFGSGDERGTPTVETGLGVDRDSVGTPSRGDAGPSLSVQTAGGGTTGGSGSGGTSDADGTDAEREGSTDGTGGTGTPTTALFTAGGVMPGSSGGSETIFGPPDPGQDTLLLTVGGVVDNENGLTEPEAEVDDTPSVGELSANLDIRIVVVRESGVRRYVAGGSNAFVPLASVSGASESVPVGANETVSVGFEWRIDSVVGNEIQGDSTTLSVHGRFTS
ncbi:hypothetical protein [Halobellus clavatus]|uniref:SipW-cognate class signal peptide n=1 Tax=Halobellus clavatus TaxID=660517 RepID=A0A1H3H4B7_9EURY|nr:hypothetical protein [Halobellus clavatus]SDY10356.1 hypothetical protein SAMN04487946_106160 [Halobellus clavatus]